MEAEAGGRANSGTGSRGGMSANLSTSLSEAARGAGVSPSSTESQHVQSEVQAHKYHMGYYIATIICFKVIN